MLYAICVSSSWYTGRAGLAACYMCVLVRADISYLYISSVGTRSYRASPGAGLKGTLDAEVRFEGVYPTSNAEFNKDGEDIKKAVAEAAGT